MSKKLVFVLFLLIQTLVLPFAIPADSAQSIEDYQPFNLMEIEKSRVLEMASAYLITGESVYASHALAHLNAWFVDESTKMNPSLLYGQAIKGRHTGRSIGIIDTIHLAEVAGEQRYWGNAGLCQGLISKKYNSGFPSTLTG